MHWTRDSASALFEHHWPAPVMRSVRHGRACGTDSSMSTWKQDRANCAVLAVIVGVLLLGAVIDSWQDVWLYQDGRQVTATIIGKGSKPGSFEYRYNINGVQYSGFGQAGRGLPEQAYVGGQALVFVSSSHPSSSSPERPHLPGWPYWIILILLVWAEFSLLKTAIWAPQTSVERPIG
jgi:hypothetical protein